MKKNEQKPLFYLTIGVVFKNAEKLKFKAHPRFLVLDPCAGTIIRFKQREDFPLNPKFLKDFFFK